MAEITFTLDREASLGLQDQLRERIIEAIYAGALRPGRKLPSSRLLARQLAVSRNTVVLAYEDLVADGHLESRERSGIFVAPRALAGRVVGRRVPEGNESLVAGRMADAPADDGARCPQNWRQYPFVFWDGRVDASLAPLPGWRKAVRLASTPRDVAQWSDGNGELDDPLLVEQVCTKLLPERGISALPEEVLVTASPRQGLQFLAGSLVRAGTPVWLEEPVDPELLAVLRQRGAHIELLQVGDMGPPPDSVVVITSARSGMASGKAIDAGLVEAVARANGIVIEQDTPADTPEADARGTALYAGATQGNVVYLGRVSPAAACSTQLAMLVADAAVIARLRRLRRIAGAVPEPLLQRTWAHFLALGHYAAALQKAREVLLARRTALRDALNHYLHTDVHIATMPGASAYWVSCVDQQDARALAARAARAGVLIQPARLGGVRHAFSMGVTSIPESRIRDGVRTLAQLLHAGLERPQQADDEPQLLSSSAIRRAIAGKTLLYNTVYGEPCTIEVRRSGELVGMAGYDNDDPDQGRWWVEDGRWFRQWNHWAYGEADGFAVAVHDGSIHWYDEAGKMVDKAVILRKARQPRR